MEHSKIATPSIPVEPLEDAPSIGYICPLYLELTAVLATFDEDFGVKEIDEDDYYYGRVGKRMAVAVQFLYGDMGPQAASRCADRLLREHPTLKHPQSICLLVGIAGGIWTEDRDIRLGDAVIATKIWNWRDGKLTENGLETTNFPENVSRRLRGKLPSFLYDHETLTRSVVHRIKLMREKDKSNDVRWSYPGNEHDRLYPQSYAHIPGRSCATHDVSQMIVRPQRSDDLPQVHDGLIASGNVVLKDAKGRAFLQDKCVHAVEMEACGVPKDFFVVRGISDYADSHKTDMWQSYAAAVAAACSRLLIDHFVATTYQNATHSPRFKSNSSHTPVSTRLQQDLDTSSISLDAGKSYVQPSDLGRATQSDVVLPTAGSKQSSVAIPFRSPHESNQTSSNHLTRPVSQAANGVLPKTNLTGTRDVTRRSASVDSEILQPTKSVRLQVPPLDSNSGTEAIIRDPKAPGIVPRKPIVNATSSTGDVVNCVTLNPAQTYYSEVWERANFQLYHDARRENLLVQECSWREPLITLNMHTADPAYASACFLTFVTNEMRTGLHDRVWLPLIKLLVGYNKGLVHINCFYKLRTNDNVEMGSISLDSDPVSRVHLMLTPHLESSPNSFIEQILLVCRSSVSNTGLPKSLFDAESVSDIMNLDANNARQVLYDHSINDGAHECSIIAFSSKLAFRTESSPEGDTLLQMSGVQILRYFGNPQVLLCGVKDDIVTSTIKQEWVLSGGTHIVRRPQSTAKNIPILLNEAIEAISGWTAINVTRDIKVTWFRGRTTPARKSSLFRDVILDMARPSSSRHTLMAWQRKEFIRFFLLEYFYDKGRCGESHLGSMRGWTIKAKQGEIFVPRNAGGKLKIAFELQSPSREGRYISMTTDNWFNLNHTDGPGSGTSIEIKFPDTESFARFHQSIPQMFWR